jgi:hypothetical protein
MTLKGKSGGTFGRDLEVEMGGVVRNGYGVGLKQGG